MKDLELPWWAVAHNPDKKIINGVQLCTRDGRRVGNAHVVKIISEN